MQMQSQPLTTTIAAPRPVEIREDFSQGVNLDLEIGSGACEDGEGLKGNKKIKQEKKESFFTAAQIYDFYIQVFVYNCISSGLPVPLHLFLPIWISVFNSFGPAVYKIYPSFVGFAPQKSDNLSKMDHGPDRCRRTDGRKWRCTKNAVPNQKYCERHMHRGRQGSRKHVEPKETFSKPDSKISIDNKMHISSLVTSEGDNTISVSVQSNLDKSRPGKNGNHAEGKESSFENVNPRKISGKKHGTAKRNPLGFISPGFGSSPKSVLHCGADKVGLGSKNAIENVPQRCRRTDGKKWQCSQEALPNQKYCQRHMHRGAKRVMLNPSNFPAPAAWEARSSNIISRSLDNSINLNTIPASPQNIDDDNSTSSSSDATTITDENVSCCLAHSLTNC